MFAFCMSSFTGVHFSSKKFSLQLFAIFWATTYNFNQNFTYLLPVYGCIKKPIGICYFSTVPTLGFFAAPGVFCIFCCAYLHEMMVFFVR